MAINQKNKNRVEIDGKKYLWWVFDEYDQTEFDGFQVKAVSLQQTHFLKYGLQQPGEKRKVVIALRDYRKLVHLADPPIFENKEGIITRSGIERMIRWCKSGDHQIAYAVIENNYQLSLKAQKTLLLELQEVL